MYIPEVKSTHRFTREQDMEEARRITARPLTVHPDIPDSIRLTHRQLYVQFCYRMSKWDSEFATMDPVIASSWLNIGLVRLALEMKKRLYKDETDLAALPFFSKYIEEKTLETRELVENCEALCKLPAPPEREPYPYEWTSEPLNIYMELELEAVQAPDGSYDFPLFIPHRIIEEFIPRVMIGMPFRVSYREVTDSDMKQPNFWMSSPFSDLMRYPPIPLVHRHMDGDMQIIYGSDFLYSIRSSYPHMVPRKGKWSLTEVTHDVLKSEKLLQDARIDGRRDEPVEGVPPTFHSDICDYAVDAYFESTFFQSFGKYSTKQARQDSDVQTNPTRQHRLDAVPPQRFRLGHGAPQG